MVKQLTVQMGRLRGINPWVLLALMGSAVLLASYLNLGLRYWQATRDEAAFSSRVQRINADLQRPPPDLQKLRAELESSNTRWFQSQGSFDLADPSDLVGRVSSLAEEASVDLASVSLGATKVETWGENAYQVQPVSIALRGEVSQIYGFLALLNRETPAVSVSNIGIDGLGGGAAAQLQLAFYSLAGESPQTKEGSRAGTPSP